MFVAKNNEPLGICNAFSKIGNDMFPDSKLAEKYGAGKTKTIEIIKGELLFGGEETKWVQCVHEKIILGWLFIILVLFLRLYPSVTKK